MHGISPVCTALYFNGVGVYHSRLLSVWYIWSSLIGYKPSPCTLHPAPCTLLLHLTYTYYVSYIFMFTCAWNMNQMILYEMKSSYMVSPVHTGLVHFLYMNILLCLNHETNNSLLNKIYKIISSTSILNLLLKFMQPLPHTQVDWLILPLLLFYPTFKDVLSIRWVMRMSDSVWCFKAVESEIFLCCSR